MLVIKLAVFSWSLAKVFKIRRNFSPTECTLIACSPDIRYCKENCHIFSTSPVSNALLIISVYGIYENYANLFPNPNGFLIVSWEGMRLTWVHLVRRPIFGILYQPRMIPDECGGDGGMRIGRGNKYSENNFSSATLTTTVPTWPDMRWNQGRRDGKPMTNRLIYGASYPDQLLENSLSIEHLPLVAVYLIPFLPWLAANTGPNE
jgi:hypothetical protein